MQAKQRVRQQFTFFSYLIVKDASRKEPLSQGLYNLQNLFSQDSKSQDCNKVKRKKRTEHLDS